MKSKLYLFDAPCAITITPSQVLEYLYCPRFIYYMECLKIKQHEDKRFKVQMGRSVHERKERENAGYLRKKLNVVDKKINVSLVSENHHIRGIIDEILFFEDGTLAPLEYKFAEYRDITYKTFRTQLAMQALLIRENFNGDVKKGYLVYTRSKNRLETIEFKKSHFDFVATTIADILAIIKNGYYPTVKRNELKCVDCCYRNICV
jgi:CRISPR-associated exonuclease Cas4